MYDFLLYIPKEVAPQNCTIASLNDINTSIKNRGLFISSKFIHLMKGPIKYFFLGDIVYNTQRYKSPAEYLETIISDDGVPIEKLRSIKGIFYLIQIEEELNRNKLKIYNSLFSILPIYYFKGTSDFFVASKIDLIMKYSNKTFKPNYRFILETLLFNYAFFNITIDEDIRLLPSNSYLEINNDQFSIHKHTNIQNFYTGKSDYWKKAKNYISELFIQEVSDYFPAEKFQISFTGGFDGRTLVSCAKHYHRNFETFSFGRPETDDVKIPLKDSKKLGIVFYPIFLDSNTYIHNDFLTYGKEMVLLTGGYSNFLYTHFLYSANILKKKTNYILTGYFGSELCRAPHIQGAQISRTLYDYFVNESEYKWIEKIKNSKRLLFLQKENFSWAFDSLIEDLIAYKKGIVQVEKLNQKLYVFIFEELLRKVFGSWIVAQSKYLNVRTPFINFEFIKELLKTELAGVNNPFFVENPVKRLKGQILYAEIIRRTSDIIYNQATGKGYKPKDLLTLLGKFTIANSFLRKRLQRKIQKPFLDNLSLLSGIHSNQEHFLNIIQNLPEYFNEYFQLEFINNNIKTFCNVHNEEFRDLNIISHSIISLLADISSKSNKKKKIEFNK